MIDRERWFLTCLLAVTLLSPSRLIAQDDIDDDDELMQTPGLIATYSVGESSVEQLVRDVAFTWSRGPDGRLQASDTFRARFSGRLLVQEAAKYRFAAVLKGQAKITVGGKVVLDATGAGALVSGDEISLAFGDLPVAVSFSGPADGQLRLFWSSDRFGVEPVPSHLFSHSKPRPDLQSDVLASQMFDVYRCARCHSDAKGLDKPDPAPSLATLRGGLGAKWIVRKLTEQPAVDSKMPHFGFTDQEATDISEFLMTNAKAARLQRMPKPKNPEDDRKAGRNAIRSVGCLACHQHDGIGASGPYSGGNLSAVASKRSRDWVYTWLKNPAALNADHRMPIVKLDNDQRRQLALVLGGEARVATNAGDEAATKRGRDLVRAFKCSSCHSIPGLPASEPKGVGSGFGGCVRPAASHVGPAYPQVADELANRLTRLVQGSANLEHGRLLLDRRNCTACHARDGGTGILPVVGQLVESDRSLRRTSQALIPPSLTAVGDKLNDGALAEAIAGRQGTPRLPWLSVRMPQFNHSKEEGDAILKYLIAHDRIPSKLAEGFSVTKPSPQNLVVGQALVGSSGFSCIACHKAGRYEPRNLALGTKGSELLGLGKRMRREYFLRWTRSPARIVPGMEMPSITRPVKGILSEDIDQQLAVAWEALNDDGFTVPTNPGSFEQFVTVKPGDRARVIRDVFTDPVEKGYIARPLVIGLNNGHNVMFDLDTFGLRHWWFGDTARQRTEGKSWYWDIAGIGVESLPRAADIALEVNDGSLIQPTTERATNGRMGSWKQTSEGLRFSYSLNFDVAGKRCVVDVSESIEPVSGGGQAGFRREVRVAGVPEGTNARLRQKSGLVDFTDGTAVVQYLSELKRPQVKQLAVTKTRAAEAEKVTSVPGFTGVRLPLSRSIMPTSLNWRADGTLVFTSLKGHVWLAKDTDADGLPDTLEPFEEGLAAPFGVLPVGDDLLVAHKPEVIRLRDTNGDDRADAREVVSTGWGYSDNYHDWTTGLVRDSRGDIYFGLGSDYSQRKRPKDRSLWRGTVLRLSKEGKTEPVSWSFRYPVGLAIDDQDRVFVTDNQGVQNTFNEVNHVQMGRHYGVPSRHEPDPDQPNTEPAIRVPHPWVRSMNAMVFLPADHASPFAGHAIGAEYDTHMLVRMSFQTVDGVVQGACYYFSNPGQDGGGSNFVGPIAINAAPNGDIYVGSIHDSGWLGGRNTGAIERISFSGDLPNGVRELRATSDGFEIELIRSDDSEALLTPEAFSVAAYTRKWQGSYATPDFGRHQVRVAAVGVRGGRVFELKLAEPLRSGYVYEVTIGGGATKFFPATGHYSVNRVPASQGASRK